MIICKDQENSNLTDQFEVLNADHEEENKYESSHNDNQWTNYPKSWIDIKQVTDGSSNGKVMKIIEV